MEFSLDSAVKIKDGLFMGGEFSIKVNIIFLTLKTRIQNFFLLIKSHI